MKGQGAAPGATAKKAAASVAQAAAPKKAAAAVAQAAAPKQAAEAVSRAALGREADPRLVAFNASIAVDRHLFREDVAGSLAHAAMLGHAGLIPRADADELQRGLRLVLGELERGELPFSDALEDIHTHVERRLVELVGKDVAGRLHTARSRNDQVALDERLWLRRAVSEASAAITELVRALLSQAARHAATPMPGYTHLQRAQPITVGHHLLAYVEMFARDLSRLSDLGRRFDVSPLGSGALAGSTIALDRAFVAKALGLSGLTTNSLDAVGSRDHLLEFLSDAAIAGVHLSRLCEELVLWTSTEFSFVQLDDAFCTGSSLMPQKRNPDVAELARGKAGTQIGRLVGLLAVVKGLPLAYNKDLQEDKKPALEALQDLTQSFAACAGMMETLTFREERLRAALEEGELTATDAAEHLVQRGVPFREAHELVGRMVRDVRTTGRRLADLMPAELLAYHEAFRGARALFDPVASLSRRTLVGAPAPRRVAAEVKRWQKRFAR